MYVDLEGCVNLNLNNFSKILNLYLKDLYKT